MSVVDCLEFNLKVVKLSVEQGFYQDKMHKEFGNGTCLLTKMFQLCFADNL